MGFMKDYWPFVLLILVVAIGAIFYYVPLPYTTYVTYIDQVPYTDTEYYQDTEAYTVEECKADIPIAPTSIFEKGINALLNQDAKELVQKCDNVIKHRPVTKSRQIIKYRDVERQKLVKKHATLNERWQDYRYS